MNVLIFSELSDASTNDVIDWLKAFDHNVFRINEEDVVEDVRICMDDQTTTIRIKVRGDEINLNEMDSIWYRRGYLNLNRKMNLPKQLEKEVYKAVSRHLIEDELMTLEKFIDSYLYDKPHLGNNVPLNSNKLIALKKAKEAGLKIPSSEINTNKKEMFNFFNKHNQDCISKGVQDILSFTVKNNGYNYATSKIERADLDEMADSFFPSLLQKNVIKKYELRIFYLNQRFFPMAIFSQSDEQTSIDFRNYNFEKPNRNIPFILPKSIEEKLKVFMQSMNMDTGSIDMIVSSENEYIFLEVNPKGQYGMTSTPCGYNLDYEIAQEITKNV
ncbi:MAG: grasp-with-spasm system ATP-grasp peptide maturase [Flavobacteriales bacterium]|nr:MAG: grasp-with-spasm system ATP-grasp peptide maturase [Flavobacteriales bacterium]